MTTRQIEPLTGLGNQQAFKAALDRAIDSEDSVSLALLDVDHFKEVNDRFGHQIGDTLLQTLAALLREVAPDAAYRVSGDEFAIVLPSVTLEQAFLRMEALRASVLAAQARFALPEAMGVTVTIGVAQYPRDAKDRQALMHAADSALLAAKEQGRNQVALPPTEEMVMKSCYYSAGSLRRLKAIAERFGRKESELLREALSDLLRKYDKP